MNVQDFIAATQREARKIWFVVVYEGAGGIDNFAHPETILDQCATFASIPSVKAIRINERGAWGWHREDHSK